MAAIVGCACKQIFEMIKCCGHFVYEVKVSQNLHQRRKVKIYICSDTVNGKNFLKSCVTLQWHRPGNTLEGDVSDVIALDQLTSPFSPRKATKMSP